MTDTHRSFGVALVGLLLATPLWAQSLDAQIAQAVTPLPEELRAGATVYRYDADTGERLVLRQGDNQVECMPKNLQTGFVRCFAVVDAARRDLAAKLAAAGQGGEQVGTALAGAEAAGQIGPATFGALRYRYYDAADRIQLLWIVSLPNAVAEDLGMSTASQRDSSLAGQGLPWMMREGTPQAHLMIPINGTELSNHGAAQARTDTQAIDDPVAQATLPLPADLRAGATVVQYDRHTGVRQLLRQGTNMIECQPRDAETGFTRCYHKALGPEQDMRAKLRAEGKTDAEIGQLVSAAIEDGRLEAAPFGSMMYRLYEQGDRLKLLWVVRLPNATAATLGMPTASQRDNALAGQGLPWMMLEGTPQAHLMIPINGTQLSN